MMTCIDILVDGEFQIQNKDNKLMWKGSSNQRVIDVKKTLAQDNPKVPILYCGDYASIKNAGIFAKCSCNM